MHLGTGRSGRRLTLAGVTAILVALTASVAAASDPSSPQSVTIEVTVEPRELTVDVATLTLEDVTYGFDYSDNANPGVSSGRLVAGSTGFTVKSGPDAAKVTAELARLQDVTGAGDATNVRWSDVFAANPDGLNFSIRLATVASCTPVYPEGCRGRTSPDFLPTINAATTGSLVTTPVPLRLPSGSGSVPQLVGGSTDGTTNFPPFAPGITGNITVNFWYLGRPMAPDAGGAPRTIELDLRYVLADA
jgi:hypothetical protein